MIYTLIVACVSQSYITVGNISLVVLARWALFKVVLYLNVNLIHLSLHYSIPAYGWMDMLMHVPPSSDGNPMLAIYCDLLIRYVVGPMVFYDLTYAIVTKWYILCM